MGLVTDVQLRAPLCVTLVRATDFLHACQTGGMERGGGRGQTIHKNMKQSLHFLYSQKINM